MFKFNPNEHKNNVDWYINSKGHPGGIVFSSNEKVIFAFFNRCSLEISNPPDPYVNITWLSMFPDQ